MKQTQIRKGAVRQPTTETDLRSPGGKPLPF